ncbi:hypothetical protein [Streptacidiphilus sp. MAP12-20]|uniref:hypothetical protein n=1 Tax=Streptacidiphilus sp. MAP12-20 TaxID=3156299 RepID=UPI0035151532
MHLLGDDCLGDRHAAAGSQYLERPVLAVHVAQGVPTQVFGDRQVGVEQLLTTLFGAVGEVDVDCGPATCTGVRAAVQLVDLVTDFPEEHLRGDPGLRLGELPRGDVVDRGRGALFECGGDPSGAELLLELSQVDQAPAVDQAVGIDDQVGQEVVAAVADERVTGDAWDLLAIDVAEGGVLGNGGQHKRVGRHRARAFSRVVGGIAGVRADTAGVWE